MQEFSGKFFSLVEEVKVAYRFKRSLATKEWQFWCLVQFQGLNYGSDKSTVVFGLCNGTQKPQRPVSSNTFRNLGWHAINLGLVLDR